MLLQPSLSHNYRGRNILIWYIFIQYILALHISACDEVFAMGTKLHQKLIEDIRLQKRLLGLVDEQNNVSKERRGSYHSQPLPQGIEAHHKRSVNLRSSGEDDGEKAYAWDDRRNSSRRRSDVKEASRLSHELAPPAHQTSIYSKPLKPFPDFAICNYSNNNISVYDRQLKPKVKIAAASRAIGGRQHNANDERVPLPGDFANSMHIYNSSTRFHENHHHRRRSLDLGETTRQSLSDSETVSNNAQARSFLQISQDAQKLGDVLKRKGDMRRDLLKGAMDLEESLRILARLHKTTGNLKNVERPRQSVDLKELLPFSHRALHEEEDPFDGRREPPRLSLDGREFGKSANYDLRDAIRASLNRQKKMYGKNADGGITVNRNNHRPLDSIPGLQQVENKKRIPNVIARLMGLEEMPSDSQAAPTKPVPNRVVGRTDSSMKGERGLNPRPQESTPRPSLQAEKSRNSVHKDVNIKAEEYEDTIKAALKRMKQQAPPKPSFQEELSQKLKRLHSVESPQQEPKTLKQILETMQVKGVLHSGPDQSKQKAADDRMHKEATIVVKLPVMEVHKPARKVQELQEKGPSRKASNAKEPSSPSDIVIIKPVNADSSAIQSPLKAMELHPKRTSKQRLHLVKSTESKKKSKRLSKSELLKAADDGQSKQKNSINKSEGTLKRPKQGTPDGVVQKQKQKQKQKHSKSQSLPVLQELKRRRSERISIANNNKKILSKPEKQRPSSHSWKAKESVSSTPRPTLRHDRGSSNVHDKHTTQIPNGPINENDMDEAKSPLSFNIDTTPQNPNVESLQGPVSQDENSEYESSSPSLQHNNSMEDSMSPVAVLELPPEADEETADDENEDEDDDEEEEAEADLSYTPIHLKVSYDNHNKFCADDNNDKFAVLNEDMDPSNCVDGKASTAREMNYKDHVWHILTRNPSLMNMEAAEPTELYPRLYFKLEEQETVPISISGDDDEHAKLERRLVLDCVKEVLKRKARLRFQMKQPVTLSRIRRASLGFKCKKSVPELVHELSDDIGHLMAYQNNVKSDKDGGDFLQSVLQEDLNMQNSGVNSIWNPSWDNGLFGEEEGQDIGRDIEKLIFDDLLERLILQL